MIDIHDELYKDLEAVKKISIVPIMLDVICRSTGMGFAAVARVTETRWLACSVRDNVSFGLAEGSELKIETTICNEIRDNRTPVVIDNVAEDEFYKTHHTPKMYGLQSYISYPIILKNGDFFGTLCAIDSKPAHLNTPEITGTFKLFAELLSFHLEAIDLVERSHHALFDSDKKLQYARHENQLYQQVSDHNLQEPLRKIALYSDILLNNTGQAELDKARATALKINTISKELINMVRGITKFSGLNAANTFFEPVDLNKVLDEACAELELQKNSITVKNEILPAISAIPAQISQLFLQLMGYAIKASDSHAAPVLKIYAREPDPAVVGHPMPAGKKIKYCEIHIDMQGINLEGQNLEAIFDIFVHGTDKQAADKYNAGLADCRKIVYNHGGIINSQQVGDSGVSFIITLPVDYNMN